MKIYIYTKESQESFINYKAQSSYVQCILEQIKEQIPTQLQHIYDVQLNKIEHNVNIKENKYNSIYIKTYNKQIQDVPIIPCFNCERFFEKNNLNVFKSIIKKILYILSNSNKIWFNIIHM
jgi:hypothetical protein